MMNIDAMLRQSGEFWNQAVNIWISGGWSMPAIAATALVMFTVGLKVLVKLRRKGFGSVPEKTWRRWIDHPAERKGPIGALLDFVTGGGSIEETALYFEELRTAEVRPFERELRLMKICVGVAPLLGLLGTVIGMLATFSALSSGSGGEKTMGMIAAGISEALITTETGLVVALPGLFLRYHLVRRFEAYQAFLAHLETVCTQAVYRRTARRRAPADRRETIRRLIEDTDATLKPEAPVARPCGEGVYVAETAAPQGAAR